MPSVRIDWGTPCFRGGVDLPPASSLKSSFLARSQNGGLEGVMTKNALNASKRLESLETVRGIAALVVVLHHLAHTFWPDILLAHSPLRSLFDGSFAVTVFFVLSGIVLSMAFFERPTRELLVGSAIRRYFRLTPPILTSVLLGYFLLRAGAFTNVDVANALGREPDQWLRHFYTFTPRISDAIAEGTYRVYLGHDSAQSYNAVLWTMSVEFEGSLFVLVFLALASGLRYRGLVYLLLAAILHVYSHYTLNFLLGVAIADCHVRNSRGRFPRSLGPGVGTAVLVVSVFVGSGLPGWFGDGIGLNLSSRRLDCQSIGAVGILVVALACPFWQRRMAYSGLMWLGRISFSLYLVHQLVICSAGCGVFLWLTNEAGWRTENAALVSALLTIVLSLTVAGILSRTVDRWSMLLGRKVNGLVRVTRNRQKLATRNDRMPSSLLPTFVARQSSKPRHETNQAWAELSPAGECRGG